MGRRCHTTLDLPVNEIGNPFDKSFDELFRPTRRFPPPLCSLLNICFRALLGGFYSSEVAGANCWSSSFLKWKTTPAALAQSIGNATSPSDTYFTPPLRCNLPSFGVAEVSISAHAQEGGLFSHTYFHTAATTLSTSSPSTVSLPQFFTSASCAVWRPWTSILDVHLNSKSSQELASRDKSILAASTSPHISSSDTQHASGLCHARSIGFSATSNTLADS